MLLISAFFLPRHRLAQLNRRPCKSKQTNTHARTHTQTPNTNTHTHRQRQRQRQRHTERHTDTAHTHKQTQTNTHTHTKREDNNTNTKRDRRVLWFSRRLSTSSCLSKLLLRDSQISRRRVSHPLALLSIRPGLRAPWVCLRWISPLPWGSLPPLKEGQGPNLDDNP